MDALIINNLSNSNKFPNVNNTNNFGNLFLQKKRNYDQSILNKCWNNYILPKKEIEFSIQKKEAKLEKIIFSIKNQNEYRDINYNIINSSKLNINELFKNKGLNLEKMNYSFPLANENINSIQNRIFNNANIVFKTDEFEEKKSEDLENQINLNSNEVKVMKNNKVVYANYIDSFPNLNDCKNKNKLIIMGKGKRGSQYRGVSRNGNQWQVLIMFKNSKSYVGLFPSEEIAARIYDILAIKKRGIKAKTNFKYNSRQVSKIYSTNIDIKAKNIDQIINELLKED
jgi:hypothetical protein